MYALVGSPMIFSVLHGQIKGCAIYIYMYVWISHPGPVVMLVITELIFNGVGRTINFV